MKRPASLISPISALAALASAVALITTASAAIAQFVDPRPSAPATPADATVARYTPPEGRNAPRGRNTGTSVTRGGGAGSCSSSSTTGLTPLAPQTHTGQTTLVQPTFAWFTPEVGERSVEFYLAEYSSDGSLEVIYSDELSTADQETPGVTTLPLSQTDFSLTPNTTYRWQVVLVCNPNRPSESVVIEADISVLEPPGDLAQALATTPDPATRASLYGEAGFWYDALSEAVIAGASSANSEVQVSLLQSLADVESGAAENDLGLEEDAPLDDSTTNSFSDRLHQVVEVIL